MKQYLTLLFITFSFLAKCQNLISNPSFEKVAGNGCSLYGNSLGFSDAIPIPTDCGIIDWVAISETPDPWWINGANFPNNFHSKYIYPHTDSVCVGGFYLFHGFQGGLQYSTEIIEGKLIKSLIKGHHYRYSIYMQLFDTILPTEPDIGQIVGSNSFSALFTDTAITSYADLPLENYKPQVQINKFVIDTQHWVQLVDTFICTTGGEKFISIGNFKRDSLTKFQLVKNVNGNPEAAYYFMDDVSLIDLDDTTNGIQPLSSNNSQFTIYPNPATDKLFVSGGGNKIEVFDLLGRVVFSAVIPPLQGGKGDVITINIEHLTNGIYLLKSTTTNGFNHITKFVKAAQ